jgi:hypothetical protein
VAEVNFEIDGRAVGEHEFRALQQSLRGLHDYHCAKTSEGGRVSYHAQAADGRWFRVMLVSGSAVASIDSIEAPGT